MRRKLVWCLFFFCIFGCAGCMKGQEEKTTSSQKTGSGEKTETTGEIGEEVTEESANMIVLTAGDQLLSKAADVMCKKIGAVHYEVSDRETQEIADAIRHADCVLIGTNKNLLEFEFSIRNCLEEEWIEGKKISLFLIDPTEEKEVIEKNFMEWYPETVLMPTFTMSSNLETIEEELGRMNGWLTTVMTYDMKTEQ